MTEIRLIDANALKEAIKELSNDNPSYWNTCDVVDREKVLDEIDNAPTVEQEITLNDSIRNIQLVCKSNNVCCVDCPMNYNCKEEPARWGVIKNETDN